MNRSELHADEYQSLYYDGIWYICCSECGITGRFQTYDEVREAGLTHRSMHRAGWMGTVIIEPIARILMG